MHHPQDLCSSLYNQEKHCYWFKHIVFLSAILVGSRQGAVSFKLYSFLNFFLCVHQKPSLSQNDFSGTPCIREGLSSTLLCTCSVVSLETGRNANERQTMGAPAACLCRPGNRLSRGHNGVVTKIYRVQILNHLAFCRHVYSGHAC